MIHDQSQLSNKANFLAFIPGSKDSRKKNIFLIRFQASKGVCNLPTDRKEGKLIQDIIFCKLPAALLDGEGERVMS